MSDIERSLRTAIDALAEIKNGSDCLYADYPKERPDPCPCAKCVASRALEVALGDWRYVGAHPQRLRFNIRERKLLDRWKAMASERHFEQLLGRAPTPADWFVAATLIQWLGTNVGMSILTESGFKYTAWEDDRVKEGR